jgi:hypothetical protein
VGIDTREVPGCSRARKLLTRGGDLKKVVIQIFCYSTCDGPSSLRLAVIFDREGWARRDAS